MISNKMKMERLLWSLVQRAARGDITALNAIARRDDASRWGMQIVAHALMHEPPSAIGVLVGALLLDESPPRSVGKLIEKTAPPALALLASDVCAPLRQTLQRKGKLMQISPSTFGRLYGDDPRACEAGLTIAIQHGMLGRFLFELGLLQIELERNQTGRIWPNLDESVRAAAVHALISDPGAADMAMASLGRFMTAPERLHIMMSAAAAPSDAFSAAMIARMTEWMDSNEWRMLPEDARSRIMQRLADDPESAAVALITLRHALDHDERERLAQTVASGEAGAIALRAAHGEPHALETIIASRDMIPWGRRMLALALSSPTPDPTALAIGVIIAEQELRTVNDAQVDASSAAAAIRLAGEDYAPVREALHARSLTSGLVRFLAQSSALHNEEGRAALIAIAAESPATASRFMTSIRTAVWVEIPQTQRAMLLHAVSNDPWRSLHAATAQWNAMTDLELRPLITAIAQSPEAAASLMERMHNDAWRAAPDDLRRDLACAAFSHPLLAARAAGACWRMLQTEERRLAVQAAATAPHASAKLAAKMRDDDWKELNDDLRETLWRSICGDMHAVALACGNRWAALSKAEQAEVISRLIAAPDVARDFLAALSETGWATITLDALTRLAQTMTAEDAASVAREHWARIPSHAREVLLDLVVASPHAAADLIASISDDWIGIHPGWRQRLITSVAGDIDCAAKAFAAIAASFADAEQTVSPMMQDERATLAAAVTPRRTR